MLLIRLCGPLKRYVSLERLPLAEQRARELGLLGPAKSGVAFAEAGSDDPKVTTTERSK